MKNLLTLLSLICLGWIPAGALNSLDEVAELYLVGDCSPTTWDRGRAPRLNNEGNGVFIWSGKLNKGSLKFVTSRDTWESVVADYDGRWLENGVEMPIELTSANGDKDNKWYLPSTARCTVRVDVVNRKITVWFSPGYVWLKNTGNWSKPKVWAWKRDGNNNDRAYYGSWPGEEMTYVKDDLYSWEMPSGEYADMFLINDDGGAKTPDMAIAPGMVYDCSGAIVATADKMVDGVGSPLGRVVSYEDDGTTVKLVGERGTMWLTPYNDGTVKVLTMPAGVEGNERRSLSVAATPSVSYSVADEGECLSVMLPQVKVVIDKASTLLSFYDKGGALLMSELGGLDNKTNDVSASFSAPATTAFYGGGYYNRFDHTARTLVMDNNQTGGWPNNSSTDNHNICIPFVVADNGFGILFDNHQRGARIIMPHKGLCYTSESPSPVAYYFVGGGDMAGVMTNYASLTGFQPLPPYWAMGYMTSRFGYGSRDESTYVIEQIRNSGIPLDGIVYDIYWQGPSTSAMGNLVWDENPDKFYRPQEMMEEYDNYRKVKTILITEPFFSKSCGNYQELKDKGFSADDDVSGMEWIGGGALLDCTNPDALDWMWEKAYKPLTAQGVGGWWLDLGEPERHDDDSSHRGGSVSEVHNEIGNLWIERVWRGYNEEFPDQRPFLMPRAGTAGMQRYSTFPWTGDIYRSYEGLAAQVPALLSSGMSGVAWIGSDVGGFAHNTDGYHNDDLYLRWVEMATFSPMMRTHCAGALEAEPFRYSAVVEDVARFINMRYSYLPYTYTLAWENATKGYPLARPLGFHYRQDGLESVGDQYLWGRDILVAPVLAAATSREVVLPGEGERWADANNPRDIHSGNRTISYDAPREVLPHFVRMGAIIPRYSATVYESTQTIDRSRITLDIYADKSTPSADGRMFEDDFHSTTSLQSGDYSILEFAYEGDAESASVSLSRSWAPLTRDASESKVVTLSFPTLDYNVTSVADGDNNPLTRVASADNMAPGTWSQGDDNVVKVCTNWNGGSYVVKLNPATSSSTEVVASGITDRLAVSSYGSKVALDVSLGDEAAAGDEVEVFVTDIAGRTLAVVGFEDPVRGTNHKTVDLGGINGVCLFSLDVNGRMVDMKKAVIR